MIGLFVVVVWILIIEIALGAVLILMREALAEALPQKMSEKDFDEFKSILQRGIKEAFERGWRIGWHDAMKVKSKQEDFD